MDRSPPGRVLHFLVSCDSDTLQRGVQLSFPAPSPIFTILVVDDQPFARRVAYRVLSEAGYRVLEAEDGEEALGALHLSRGRVALVMVDIVMPKMDGVELVSQVWDRWPEMRILFTSGHAAEVLAEHGMKALDVPFLAKPYTRDEALEKVQEALGRHPASRREPPDRA
jgi:two-component system, cell cycle sensor histidine kinase and response regulator CckA